MIPIPASPPLDNNWVRYRSICYLSGRGLSFGAADMLPKAAQALRKYAVNVDVAQHYLIDVCDDSFSVFAQNSLDFAFVGKRLEVMIKPQETLREIASKLRVGGHLILHVTLDSPDLNASKFSPESLMTLVAKSGSAWIEKDIYLRNGEFLGVYKKVAGSRGVTKRVRHGKKRAVICRYGAMGDLIQLTPLIRALHEDGYEVTMNVTPRAMSLVYNNPFVSNIILQESEAIPNPDLGGYWKEWAGDYDKYINLSESIEGRLLFVPGRREFYTSKAFRHSVANLNYHEHHMALGGYASRTDLRPELFFTRAEERDMKAVYDSMAGRFVILWATNGSALHKVYPLMEPVLRDWLALHSDATVLSLGDASGKAAEFSHPRVVPMCGEWTARQTALATKYASLVLGPETFVLNAASCFPTPKITLLSHSSHENLCKHWEGDFCLAPDVALSPCYPCHQLHYPPGEGETSSCPLVTIGDATGTAFATGPSCAMGAITGERLIARMNEVYDAWKAKR